MRNSAVLTLFLSAIYLSPAMADEKAGLDAYQQGDYQRAFTLLYAHSQEAKPEVHFRLGQMYNNGWGVARDPVMAVRWYHNAANAGHTAALYNLAGMYHKGDGVPQNYNEARRLSIQAAKLGYAKAGIYLGDVYTKGIGTARDYKQAYAWFGVAGHDGDAMAIFNQSQVARTLSPEDRLQAENQLQGYLQGRPAATPEPSPAVETETVVVEQSVLAPVAVTAALSLAPMPADEAAQAPESATIAAVQTVSQPPAALRSAPAGRLRQVKPGESLYIIARDIQRKTSKSLKVVMASLKRENPGLASRPLKPGEWLQLPSFAAVQTAQTAKSGKIVTAGKAKGARLPVASRSTARVFDVVAGDTLYSIARRVRPSPDMPMSVVIDALRSANPWILGPESIRVGERVRVPDFGAFTAAYTGTSG